MASVNKVQVDGVVYDIAGSGGGGGGGLVDSVNGMIGDVVLTASDVGALATTASYVSSFNGSSGAITYTAPVTSVNGSTGAVTLSIPSTASDVGAIASPSSPTSGNFLKYNGSSWVADNAPVTSVNGNTGAVSLSIPSTPSDIGAEPAVTEVTISTTGAVTQALDAGKIYHFTGAITALTITLNATTGVPHYHFDFLSGSTAATLTMPGTVTMPDSFAVEASKRYEVDVLNNYGAVISWATS